MYCEHLCKTLLTFCPYEPHRLLKDLGPYDHLRRFFRICTTHFKRNVNDLRSQISSEVRSAMLSIASSDPHPDLDGAFEIIEKGGAKAKGNINDLFKQKLNSQCSVAKGQASYQQICDSSSLPTCQSYPT